MGETSLFLTLSAASVLLVSAHIIRNQSEAVSRASAQVFYWLCIALSVAAFIWVPLIALGYLPEKGRSIWWYRVLIYRAWLVIGTAVSCAGLLVLNRCMSPPFVIPYNTTQSFLKSPYILKALSLSVSMSFLGTEIGKLAHDADMRQFFLQSGFPVWCLYFTVIAETIGAVGLLVQRTAVLAALGLSGIMIGAIATHAHNRDPLSDSLEALHLLILLACILVLRLLQDRNASLDPSHVVERNHQSTLIRYWDSVAARYLGLFRDEFRDKPFDLNFLRKFADSLGPGARVLLTLRACLPTQGSIL